MVIQERYFLQSHSLPLILVNTSLYLQFQHQHSPNYQNYIAAWNPNYQWTGLSNKTTNFNGLSNTCHISAMVSVTKYTIVTTSDASEYDGVVYTDKEKAESALNSIKNSLASGDNRYTVEIRGSGGNY